MKNTRYKYCYQCSHSKYIKSPNVLNNELCLYCRIGEGRGTYIEKDMLIGDCPHFDSYALSPAVKAINRLRGIDEMSRSRSELNEPASPK